MNSFTIQTEQSHLPADESPEGSDTTIFVVPESLLVAAGTADLRPYSAVILHKMFDGQARDLGRLLHHADVTITQDPEEVRKLGILPQHTECEECQMGLKIALEHLAASPTKVLCVAQLYWTANG